MAYQTAGFPVPAPGFAPYGYRTASHSPMYGGAHYYPASHYPHPSAAGARGHVRRATGDGIYATYLSTPRKSYTFSSPDPTYHSGQPKAARRSDYVSPSERARENPHGTFQAPTDKYGGYAQDHRTHERHAPRPHPSGEDYTRVRSDESLPRYEQFEPRPPPYGPRYSPREHTADRRYHDQERVYSSADPSPDPRARRASYSAQQPRRPMQAQPQPQQQPQRPRTAPKQKRVATDADALRQGVPAGFSLKFWDPDQEPILLLGSVFDADSLGKWIYDWAVYCYGTSAPLSNEAAELRTLLVAFASRITVIERALADSGAKRIRAQEHRDLLDEFNDAGERVWDRFSKLLRTCENHMWKVAKKESGNAKKISMGKNSGIAFVEAMFDRDHELRVTEKVMQHIRTFIMRFDVNCIPFLGDFRL